jgi:hypothetical protein
MANKVTLKNVGLFTNVNSLGSVPQGAMLKADNIVIDKDDIVEIRRGFKIFGDAIGVSPSNTAKQLMNYKDRILRHYEVSSGEGYLEYQDDKGGTSFTEYNRRKFVFADSLTSVSGTATFQTDNEHGILLGDTVVIENASASGYNGTFTVTAVPTPTTFQYTITDPTASATGAYLLESTYNNVLEPQSGIKIKYVEANKNLYFTTSEGVKKIDTFDATVVDSGAPKALDISLELYDAPGFFEQEGQVGYRVVWGYKDINENLILGAASSRAFIANSGSTLFINDFNNLLVMLDNNPGLQNNYASLWTLPDDATVTEFSTNIVGLANKLDLDPGVTDTNYFSGLPTNPVTTLAEAQEDYDYLVDKLNSDVGVNENDFPNATTTQQVKLTITIPKGVTQDYFYQVYRTSESAALDVQPDENYQLVYESNPTLDQIQQGLLTVVDITPNEFRGAALYQNPGQEGDAQANEQPPFALDLSLYSNMLFYANTKTKQTLEFDLVGLDPLSAGVTGSNLIFDNGIDTFTITFSSTTEDATNGVALLDLDPTKSVSQRVDSTARSIVRTVNRFTDNSFLSAYYTSIPTGVPGKILLESITVSLPEFSITAQNSTMVVDGNTVSAYSPELINAETSDNEVKPNRIYYSKLQEPEAVPLLNFFNIGGGDNVIYRIQSLRDGLFIFSDEGIFKIVGDTPDSLSLSQFDNTAIIKAPESLAKGNNQIFLFTDQGICTVSDSGVNIISRYIEDKLLKLLDPSYTNFQSSTFGVFYQVDRKYVIFTVENTTDSVATQAFTYNVLTGSWVRWPISKTCGIVNTYDQRLYFGASDTNFLEQERKDFSYRDHADREYSRIITEVSQIIKSISVGNPVIVEAFRHGLNDYDLIEITGSDSTPSIDGQYRVQILDNNNFLISDVTTTVAGTTGRWVPIETVETNYQTLELNSAINVNIGDVILQEKTATVNTTTYTYTIEAVVNFVDTANNIVKISNNERFIVDDCTVYDYIPVQVEWVPIHAGDPSVVKQFREIHLIFDQFRGSDVKISVASDVQKAKETIDFELQEFGNWGAFPWGEQPWGGTPKVKEIRTYIPSGKQRCKLLNVTFLHEAAREKWRLEGLTVFFRNIAIGERSTK